MVVAEVNPDELAGKIEALPRSLVEAVTALLGDSVLCDGLGEPLVKAVIAIRKVRMIQLVLSCDLETFFNVADELYFVSDEVYGTHLVSV